MGHTSLDAVTAAGDQRAVVTKSRVQHVPQRWHLSWSSVIENGAGVIAGLDARRG